MKHIHILGIGGTFMSGLASLAREAGFKVTGSDTACYSPVSDLLQEKSIPWQEGYEHTDQALQADCVIVGNVMKRGMPVLEAVIEKGANYTSGPQWLAENILSHYRVIAVAGTHGKTTTTSMLAWILYKAGLQPGFLIGGVASDFKTSARLGSGQWFVIEADEYDSAFFDKRPKFMHYRPKTAIINNLEYDHADIYDNLAAIQKQFHYFLRTIPASGTVIKPGKDKAINQVLQQGSYCHVEELSIQDQDSQWSALLNDASGRSFTVFHKRQAVAEVNWSLLGRFNVENGLAAIAASTKAGITPQTAAEALNQFSPVKRRLQVIASLHNITIYDDFAHHPTAIAKTIEALRSSKKHKRILAVMEFASYTMKTGKHTGQLEKSLSFSDKAFILQPSNVSLKQAIEQWTFDAVVFPETNDIVNAVINEAKEGDAVLIMSNRKFDNIHQKFLSWARGC